MVDVFVVNLVFHLVASSLQAAGVAGRDASIREFYGLLNRLGGKWKSPVGKAASSEFDNMLRGWSKNDIRLRAAIVGSVYVGLHLVTEDSFLRSLITGLIENSVGELDEELL